MNQVQTQMVTTVFTLALPYEVLATVLVIKTPFTRENFVYLVVFINLVMVTLTTVFAVLGVLSQIYTQCMNDFGSIKIYLSYAHGKSKYKAYMQKKYLNSFSPIKVKFGSINFIEKLTPVNAVDFANGLIVNILLLTQ